MPPSFSNPHWGAPPWRIAFHPATHRLPASVDYAVIGCGFTGLAAAAWLARLAPKSSVAVFEAGRIGHGASGRTGGMALGETASGAQEGLGDVLAGLRRILKTLRVSCDLSLTGAWEIARQKGLPGSPIAWDDSGTLHVVKAVPGGTLDPGKLVAGLGRAAERLGAKIHEGRRVIGVEWKPEPELDLGGAKVRAKKILFATNAFSLASAGIEDGAHPRLTLAAATASISKKLLREIGLAEGKPFYTVDFPYLWGRVMPGPAIIFGAGLVSAPNAHDVEAIDIAAADAATSFASLEERVRNMHPALARLKFARRWGGPILFRDNWTPVFDCHPSSRDAIVLGAYAGHGVALSSYLGTWAAEALLGHRNLPPWGRIANSRAASASAKTNTGKNTKTTRPRSHR
jgi:glycine/D-amino acid oxidase-like deaminating enzyme